MTAGRTGILLAGGLSRRMGRDKSRLQIAGRTLLESTVLALETTCEEIVVAGGWQRAEDWPGIGAVWVPDPPGYCGPLAGLAAGLEAATNDECLVLACDMPFSNPELLCHLANLLSSCDAVMPHVGGFAQPLHAAYSSSRCLPAINSLLRLGARSIRDLLPRICVAFLGEESCRRLDPAGLSWFNMNTPEDLKSAVELVGCNQGPARPAASLFP